MHLHRGILDPQQDKRNERNAGHAVSLEAVSAGADRVTCVVTGTIGDHARVACVIFLNLEDDLHQVGADVGNLGEYPTGDTQRGRAERFANGKADKTGPGIVARNEQQDDEHHQELDADQHHADAHAGLERNLIDRIRFAA